MDEVVSEVEAHLSEIQGRIESLRVKINSVLAKAPGWLDWIVERVQAGWDAVCAKMAEFGAWFTDKLAYRGDQAGLEAAALSWNHDVGGPASEQSQLVDLGDLKVDGVWSGDAAEQYLQKLPEQQSAMAAIRDEYASVISGALDAIRGGINAFWWGVVEALAALAVAIIGALTATGTVIGLPAAPVCVVAGAVVALIALGHGVSELNSGATSANNTLDQAATYGMTSWPTFALS